jgi:hypothetical protein
MHIAMHTRHALRNKDYITKKATKGEDCHKLSYCYSGPCLAGGSVSLVKRPAPGIEEPLRSDISQQLHISQFRLNPAINERGKMII